MDANLDITYQGVKGGKLIMLKNKSACMIDIDCSNMQTNYILIDAFQGQGKQYKRREKCNIRIIRETETIFDGDFSELCKLLTANK